MKKRVIVILLVLLCTITMIGISSQYTPYSKNQKVIYQYLRNQMGANQAVSCGIMANLYFESKYNPHLTGDRGSSYGICQWHNVRWKRMKSYCKKHKLDDKSLEGQLQFMNYELKHHYRQSTYNKLIELDNSEASAQKAAEIWCRNYERPAAVDEQAKKRGRRAAKMFFDLYDGSYKGRALLKTDDVYISYQLDGHKPLVKKQTYHLKIKLMNAHQSLPVNRLGVYYLYEVNVIVTLGSSKVFKRHYDHEDTIDLTLKPKKKGTLKVKIKVTGDKQKTFTKTYHVNAS